MPGQRWAFEAFEAFEAFDELAASLLLLLPHRRGLLLAVWRCMHGALGSLGSRPRGGMENYYPPTANLTDHVYEHTPHFSKFKIKKNKI